MRAVPLPLPEQDAPKTLIIVGLSFLLLLVPILLGFTAGLDYMKAAAARVKAQEAAGQTPDPKDKKLADIWTKNIEEHLSTHSRAAGQGLGQGDGDLSRRLLRDRQASGRPAHLGPDHRLPAGQRLHGGRPDAHRHGPDEAGGLLRGAVPAVYLWMVGLGYGIGLPLMVFDGMELIGHGFSADYMLHGGIFYNAFGSLVVALGHVGLLMLIVQSGVLGWLTRRLAAVGRMALSNYLTHSIVCTTLFYGYGFNLFGTINRTGLAAIVLTIWIFQLVVSPIWLKYFRFGPAEWLWRSLTYWRLQPMRVVPAEEAAVAA